tara:strand:- start:423 stop:2858 length:2436 start_codon:yes stop_codon:yes gene_type:complete
MSLNKVLNRPMFRREALRRGVLKPIKAKTGQMIFQGPGMMQGPPVNTAPYSMIPTQYQGPQGRSFSYDPRTGTYLTGYGKAKMATGGSRLAKGLTGVTALYEGARAAGIPDPLINTAYYGELAGLPLALARGKTARDIGSVLTVGSRFATGNPVSAIGIGGALATTGGAKSYFDERKLVEDYAKANDISVKKAMDIFNRDMVGKGGRPISEFRKSDLGKAVIAASSARNILAGGLDKTPEGPPGTPSAEQRIAGEMRKYFDQSKVYGRYYQDVDELVKKVKDKEKQMMLDMETASMSPEDQMVYESTLKQGELEKNMAVAELRNAIMTQNNLDVYKASNIATAITEGDIEANRIKEAATNDDVYATIKNRVNDPNHPEAIKLAKTDEEIQKKVKKQQTEGDGISTEKSGGSNTGTKQDLTGVPEIDEAKAAAETIDMTQFLKADPRKTEMDPQKVFLLKLASGLLSGKTMKGGPAGLAEIFGTALGPALDAKILVKMKNDEAYRDWASTVLSYNTDLLELRNDALKDALDAAGNSKFELGSFEQGGQFFEAKKDKNTGEVYVYDGKEYRLASPDAGQFYVQKDSAAYMDNIRLIADGQLSADILREQIALMSTDAGRKAIGGSGVILGFAEVLKNLPGEVKDGLVGSVSTDFTMSQGDMSDEAFKDLEKRTEKVLTKFEDRAQKFLSGNPSASEILGKLKVNARTLTYTLANALKDKDRLTNRDLDLIEELTGFLGVEPDAKIVQKYEELLGIVEEKNRLRKNRFYTMGYTNNDIQGILNSFGTGKIIQGTSPDAFATDLSALDFLMGENN